VETVETQKVKTAFLSVGDSHLELLEPTEPNSTVAKFIEKRGEGIHHICLRVDKIEPHLETLKARGYRLINEAPVPGAHNCRVAFLHPSAGNGVLIELAERMKDEGFESTFASSSSASSIQKFFGVLRPVRGGRDDARDEPRLVR
jgi:methylmalonyl-CoA epimerase